jgi:hypothetical protein
MNGFQMIDNHVVVVYNGTGKFGGYFEFRNSCEELCRRDYGLLSCIGYLYDPTYNGKCTIFQYTLGQTILTHDPSSTVSLRNSGLW